MLNLPTSFKEKFEKLLGKDEAAKMFAAINQNTKKAYRVNPLKAIQQVSYDQDEAVPDLDNAYYGEVNGQDPEWVSGTVYSQDPAAMFPAKIAKVKPGEKVLDLCAAPGGKSTALGQALKGEGVLVANEISGTRVKALRENIERWGISNALITNNDSETLAKNFPDFFDKIVVDAPCSGEGMFRKNPDAINYWSPEYILTCQSRQKEILQQAVKMLKPGGKLIYSTCTFSPEEDEEIVAWLVEQEGFKVLPIPEITSTKISHGHPEWTNSNLVELKETLRFWPQDNVGEGQFAAILQKSGEPAMVNEKKVKKNMKNKKKQHNKLALTVDERKLVGEVLDQFDLPIALKQWSKQALVRQDHVFIPALTDESKLRGLKIVNNGLELGLLKKKRLEPSHQLAEVLGQVSQTRVVDLAQREDYLSYLHGETVKVDTNLKGFVLVSYQDLIFSFGKVTGQKILKNFYPKGLRILKKN
ncbi:MULTISPECIES: RsmB/NOP family class I SAM-dependent RNA methyltransferase [Lactobacillus]|uniref:RNA methyltransferase n=1 Tax=Lactobacillus xujianguonis TaxID=2495899 RepID=A0A437SXR6_9LACO|nr:MULTISPECIES: RsmB/NOP family class I SAM-dependent RNA methyltransferase [Lactobacillus]RVU71722.1 RNA methyltransferase [Lactobacillus xujianguonis]RVU77552.1 RNA methyltransferase [Lactobacillus xujianguonis]